MHPLEDAIVALQPKTMTLPAAWTGGGGPGTLPDSTRSQDPTSLATSTLTVIDPFGTLGGGQPGNPTSTYSNATKSFGWEYVWHCHILGHEENDFMRSFVMLVPTAPPAAPSGLTALDMGNAVQLDWTDNANLDPTVPDLSTQKNVEIGFRIERNGVPITTVYSGVTTYTDTVVANGATYNYQVIAYNAAGDSAPSTATITLAGWTGASGVSLTPSVPSPSSAGTPVLFTAAGSGATVPYQYRFWMNAGSVPNLIPANMVQDYGVGNTWTLPASTIPGTYTCSVGVRTNLSSPTPDAITSVVYVVAAPVIPPGAGAVRISRMPGPTILSVPTGTLTDAFAAALAGDTIQAWGLPFAEPAITFTTAGTVTFIGGYDTTFTTTPSMTTLQGSSLTVGGVGGTLIVQNLIIQ